MSTLPSQSPWQDGATNQDQELETFSEQLAASSALAGLFRGRSQQRIAIGAGCALLVAGLGIWLARRHRQPDAPQVVQSASVAPAPAAPAADREMSAAQATIQRAHLQIEAGQTKAAEKMLKHLLRQKLARNDRAFALRLMGATEARRGHRRAAIAWFNKSLKVTDDAAERDRVARRVQQLKRAKSKKDLRAAGSII